MDKITFNFEENKILIETDGQCSLMSDPKLASRKSGILKAAGLEAVDLQPVANIIERFLAGKITEKELEATLNAWAEST